MKKILSQIMNLRRTFAVYAFKFILFRDTLNNLRHFRHILFLSLINYLQRHNTLSQKIANGKKHVVKSHTFNFRKLQLMTVLLSVRDSHLSGTTKFVCSNMWVGFSILDSVSFSLKFTFSFNKKHGLFWLWNLKIPFKTKIKMRPQTLLLPGL